MKKSYNMILFLIILIPGYGQSYFSFPITTATWYKMFWYAPYYSISCSQYVLEGDTALNERWYHKIYEKYNNSQCPPSYLGGIREDIQKRIYFAPVNPFPISPSFIHFPDGEPEVLLYTFDNLSIGMHLPINTTITDIIVYDIDSVLLGNSYRKRYLVYNPQLLGYDYWIEGIGSTKDLFSPYAREFEWMFYTLCFEDTVLYHLYTNGYTECYYGSNVGIPNVNSTDISVFPNPANDFINLDIPGESLPADLFIYDYQGVLKQKLALFDVNNKIDIRTLGAGFNIIKIIFKDGFKTMRFTKI